jgi:hypothetical protein
MLEESFIKTCGHFDNGNYVGKLFVAGPFSGNSRVDFGSVIRYFAEIENSA